MEEQQHTPDRRVYLGVALLLLGGVWLLDNLNIIPYQFEYYIFSWRTLLIALGAFFIVARQKIGVGVVLIAIGSFFWLDRLDFFYFLNFNVWSVFWPLIIIAIGISLITRRNNPAPISADASGDPASDVIDDFAVFGGRERTINSQNFRGGKITAMFGGSEIDLRGASLAPGTHVLDIFVMFGGTHILVPPDWNVRVEVFSLLGGFGDKRYSNLTVIPDAEKTLVIKGFVMFGGGEVSLNK